MLTNREDQHTWNVLFDALLGELGELSRRVREAMRTELPAYRSVPAGTLDEDVRVEVERVLRAARAGSAAASEHEIDGLAVIGKLRAQQGVPVDDMLRAWRIGVQIVVSHAREVGSRLGIDDERVLEFVESALAWSDVAMVTTARAHRQAEVEVAAADQERRSAFVRDALLGVLAPAELRIQAESYLLDPDREYVAVRARGTGREAARTFEHALGLPEAVRDRCGLSTLWDGDLAGFLYAVPETDFDGVAGVGPPRPLEQLAESYRLATRALTTASACGLTGVHDLPSLSLRAAVAADAEIGDILRARYLDPLADSGSADELMATVRSYLACGTHVETTARRLFVHQNTVRYRLARFEELTGANLREPEVAFEAWWALTRAAMRW